MTYTLPSGLTISVFRLNELLSQIKAATGPDMKLDWNIAELFDLIPDYKIQEIGWDYVWFRHPTEYVLWKALDSEGRNMTYWSPKALTSSINLTLDFIAEVLPTATWTLTKNSATLYVPGDNGFHVMETGNTPELALLACLVTAIS